VCSDWLWQARTLVSSALSTVDAIVRRYVREEEQLIARLSSPRPPVGPLHRLEHDLDVNVLHKAHSLDGLLDEDAKLGARVAKLGHFENG
jgi:hypothetical protein